MHKRGSSRRKIGFCLIALITLFISGCSSSPNKILQWEQLPFPASSDIISLSFPDDKIGYVLTSLEEVYKTSDGGKTFTKLDGILKGHFTKCYFINSESGFLLGHSGYFARTADGGRTWTSVSTDSTIDWRDLAFLDKEHGFLIGTYESGDSKGVGIVGTSNDQGLTWKFENTQYRDLRKLDIVKNNHVWILGAEVLVYSTDQGATWEHTVNRSTDTVRSLCFGNMAQGWEVGDRGLLRYSQEGGWKWADKPKLTNRDVTCVAMHQVDVIYVAGDQFMAASTNHGRFWVIDSVNYPVKFYDLQSVGNEFYLAGSKGTLLKLKR